jgi:group I intron endonuclease
MSRADKRKYHIIYKTTCLLNGRYYIGMHSTDDLDDGYMGSGLFISSSVKKHGPENHRLEILESFPTRAELREREKILVTEELLRDPLCMNLALGGSASKGNVNYKHSPEARAKISAAQRGKPKPRISKALKGRKMSEEWRRKLSEAAKRRNKNPEYIKRISETLKGRKHSEERKAAIAQGTKEGLAAMSDEQRASMIDARKRTWKEKR